MINIANAYLRAGLCVLPAFRNEKRPALTGWKEYQKRLPTEEEVGRWFGRQRPMCIITGAVSGNLEMIDFDHGGELFDRWAEQVATESPEILDRLVVERSQSGGRHVVYRCAVAVPGNLKLAQRIVAAPDGTEVTISGKRYRPRRVGDHYEVTCTLIETRGEGGLFLCHPTTGYALERGSFESLPVLTEAERNLLVEAAWSLNEAVPAVEPATFSGEISGRPGDEFNDRGDVRALLERHGWTCVRSGENECWRRPGKDRGWSATLREGVLYVFSSNAAPFEPHRAYSPFAVYCLLEHEGDFARAASALRDNGFGQVDPCQGVDLSHIEARLRATRGLATLARAGVPDPGPFPAHLLGVPGFLAEVMAYNLVTSFRPQPVLALGAAIALLGTLTGRKVCDEMNTRTNVYCLGVCPSGGGKERARQVNKEIIFLAGAPEMVGPEGLASHAGLISAVEKQPAVLFQLDEIGRMLKTLGDPGRAPHLYHIATNLMKLFTSSSSVYVGDAYADPKRNRLIHQPHACVYGTTVPQSLYEGITTESVTDGFLSRVMIMEAPPENVPKRRPTMQPVPASIVDIARWWAEFQPGGNLAAENPVPRVIPATEEVFDLFDAMDAEAEAAQATLGEPLGTLWTRAVEKAHKLALIYACSENHEDPAIGLPAAQWACDLSRYLTRRMILLASQWVAENPFDAKRKRVLRLIHEQGQGGLSRSELYGKTRAFTTRERAEILEALLLCGDVLELREATGGAPRVRYVATVHTQQPSS